MYDSQMDSPTGISSEKYHLLSAICINYSQTCAWARKSRRLGTESSLGKSYVKSGMQNVRQQEECHTLRILS